MEDSPELKKEKYDSLNVLLDGEALCQPLDLYDYPNVGSTGELDLGQRQLTAGSHELTLEITGANESAIKNYMVGLDYLRLRPASWEAS